MESYVVGPLAKERIQLGSIDLERVLGRFETTPDMPC